MLGDAAKTLAETHQLRLLNLNRCEGSTDLASGSGVSSYPPDVVDWLTAHALPTSYQALLVSPLTSCASLTWLDVGWLTDLMDDSAVAWLLAHLPKLEVLSVEGCKMLTDAAFGPLVVATPLVRPRDDSLGCGPHHPCQTIADGTVAPLQRLNCSWVDTVTNEGLFDILRVSAARCADTQRRALRREHHLQVLDYYGCVWAIGADGSPQRARLRGTQGEATGPGTGLIDNAARFSDEDAFALAASGSRRLVGWVEAWQGEDSSL